MNQEQIPPKAAFGGSGASAILKAVRKHFPLLLCAAAAALALAVVIYFIVGPAEGYFHADCTDTILWAQSMYESGKVFDPNFNYAALLPFGAPLWFIPLIALFGVSMKAHVIGMVIFALLFLAATVLLLRRMQQSYASAFGISALLFLVLSSSEKLREIMWNHVIYYSLGLLLYFFLLSLAFYAWDVAERAEQRNRVLRYLPLAGLFVLTLLTATNGSQMLILTVLPIAAAIFLERLFDRETKLLSKCNIAPILLLIAMVAGVLVGTFLLEQFLNGSSSAYATGYSRFSPPTEWAANLDKFFMHHLTLLGMDVSNQDEVFSLKSIVNLLRIGVAILLFVVPAVALACYRKIENRYVRVLLLGHTALVAFLFFGVVCGRLGAADWRLVPCVGSAVVTTAAVILEAWRHRTTAICTVRLGVLVLAALALLSAFNVKTILKMPYDYGRDNQLHLLTETLEKEGLSYGYATFWRSQSITLLSDSRVRCREILVESDNKDPLWGIKTDHYQSSLKWYEDQEGVDEYFVLLSRYEYNQIVLSDYWIDLVDRAYVRDFEVDDFVVFVFSENIWGSEAADRVY